MAAPTVTTNTIIATDYDTISATGQIVSTGGVTPTIRGFDYNTEPFATGYPVVEYGSFSTGTFNQTLDELTPGVTYYLRAFATNTDGTGYGSWVSVTLPDTQYEITIDGEDRTADVINQSIVIQDIINDQVNQLSFSIADLSGLGLPTANDEIIITGKGGDTIFGGYITNISKTSKRKTGEVIAKVKATDYTWLLDRKVVRRTYEDMTDKEIIDDIVSTYCSGSGITTTNVIETATIDQITFNYLQPSQCIRKISELTGNFWYIDYDKDIHYAPIDHDSAPITIDSNSNNYYNLNIEEDINQLKNRVYVRGGTKLSDFTTYSEKGDGEKTKFVLPDKPHDVSVQVNAVTKSVGIKNLDTSGYDWYLNFQEKYLEQDAGGAVLTSSDIIEVTYKYDIPILVAVENSDSIADNGLKEFAIFDKSIRTTQAARDRASAELIDYANQLVQGSFTTLETGLVSGQYVNIVLPDYGINGDYVIQKITASSLGAGLFEYDVSVASAKTLGIIKFLVKLLEANKNLVELNDDEVLDEILSLEDALLSDSLLDSLTIDSAGPYRTWANTPTDASPTRARWNLFAWK